MSDRVVLWDFDGTLAFRTGMWSGCMIEVLDEHERDHGVSLEAARAAIRGGFPWHAWQEPHPHLCEADAWWEVVQARIALALEEVGVAPPRCAQLARAVRERYVDSSVSWQLFDDTLAALARVADAGWRSVVLSNHVPELGDLVWALGLGERLEDVFTSARTGYEKPHPEAFRIALRACGNPESVWMVGDNPEADVRGAEALGLPAILVRVPGRARHRVERLDQAAEVIVASAAPAARNP